jgi:hypothetical protein
MLEMIGLLLSIQSSRTLITLPYQRTGSQGPLKTPDDFNHVEFVQQFRFRKAHFHRILCCLKDSTGQSMMNDDGPAVLRLGRHRHRFRVLADSAFMVLLRRLAYPARWCDLVKILGGSITMLSDTFNSMVRILYAKFHKLVASLAPWRRHFRAFAQHLADWGCLHDNLVAIFDGHFQATCRQGGDANHSLTLHDKQTFSGKERLHGLKYQACVMPNCICCVGGPWRGTEHDTTMFAN